MKSFSLMSLFLAVTVIAVLYSAWNQQRQAAKIDILQSRLAFAEEQARLNSRIFALFRYLDVNDSSEKTTICMVKNLTYELPDPNMSQKRAEFLSGLCPHFQLSYVDGQVNGQEILSIASLDEDIPGLSYSVNVLFDNGRVIDMLVRETSTRMETHNVEHVDTDDDNRLELLLNCRPEFGSSEPPKELIYFATETGFSRKIDF